MQDDSFYEPIEFGFDDTQDTTQPMVSPGFGEPQGGAGPSAQPQAQPPMEQQPQHHAQPLQYAPQQQAAQTQPQVQPQAQPQAHSQHGHQPVHQHAPQQPQPASQGAQPMPVTLTDGGVQTESAPAAPTAHPQGQPTNEPVQTPLVPFAIASLEVMNLKQILETLPDPAQGQQQFQQDVFTYIAETAKKFQGVPLSVHHHVLFMAFPYGQHTTESAQQSVEFGLNILKERLSWQGQELHIRIGVALEYQPRPSQVTSVTERTMAKPHTLFLSQSVFQMLDGNRYQWSEVGPVSVGSQTLTFYHITDHASVGSPQPQTQLASQAAPLQEAAPQHPQPQPQVQAASSPQAEGAYEPSLEIHGNPPLDPVPSLPDEEPPSAQDLLAEPPGSFYDLPLDSTPTTATSGTEIPAADDFMESVAPPETMTSPDPQAQVYQAAETVESPPPPRMQSTEGEYLPPEEFLPETPPESAEAYPPSDDIYTSDDFAVEPHPMAQQATPIGPNPVPDLMPQPQAQAPAQGSSTSASLPPLPKYSPPSYSKTQTAAAPNVNYEQAVEKLADRLSAALGQGTDAQGEILVLSASEGLGKTTIIQMARGKADPPQQNQQPNAFWLGGSFAYPTQGTAISLTYWVELIQNFFGLGPHGTNKAEAASTVSRILNHLFNGQIPDGLQESFQTLLFIGELDTLTVETRRNKGRLAETLYTFFSVLAKTKPVILVMEDLELADPASIEVLIQLASLKLFELPVTLIATQTRQFQPTEQLAQLLKLVKSTTWVVADLNPDEVSKFLGDGPLAGTIDAFPPSVLDQIIKQSRGLPLYLEEGLRLLHLEGHLEVEEKTGKFTLAATENGPPQTLTLPGEILDTLAVRMRYLPEEALYALSAGSILGEKWHIQTLMDICQFDQESANAQLQVLWENGWIVPETQVLVRFRHRSLWKAAYNSIDAPIRQELHGLVSQYLENGFKDIGAVHPGHIAYHAEKAGNQARAFQFWNLAGVHAANNGSITGANMAMYHAMKMLHNPEGATIPDAAALAYQLSENMGILNIEDNTDLSIDLLTPLVTKAKVENDAPKQIDLLEILSTCQEFKGDYETALSHQDDILTIFSKAEFPIEYAAVQMRKVDYLNQLGKIKAGLDLMEHEVLAVTEGHDLRNDDLAFPSYLMARRAQAQLKSSMCDMSAYDIIDEGSRYAKEENLESTRIDFELTRAYLHLLRGQYKESQTVLEQLLTDIEALDDPAPLLAHWGLIALIGHCDTGDWGNAQMLIPNCMYQAEQAKDYPTWLMANTYAGWIQVGQGKATDGRKVIENAITTSAEYKIATTAIVGWRLLAETEFKLGNKEVAAEIALRALDVAQKDDIMNRYEILLLTQLRARCLMTMGQLKEAGKLLEPRWPEAVKLGFPPLVAQLAYAIGDLYYNLSTTVPNAQLSVRHRERSSEFYQKASAIWSELDNGYMVSIVDQIRRMRFHGSKQPT